MSKQTVVSKNVGGFLRGVCHSSRRIPKSRRHALERANVTRQSKQEARDVDRKEEFEKCSLPICLAEVMLVDGRHTQTNDFVVLMFIHLQEGPGFGEPKHSTTTARRVLLRPRWLPVVAFVWSAMGREQFGIGRVDLVERDVPLESRKCPG